MCFLAEYFDRRGCDNPEFDAAARDFKDLHFDVVADEETLPGATAHHEHGTNSSCKSGCLWLYRSPGWITCTPIRESRLTTTGPRRLTVGSASSGVQTSTPHRISLPIRGWRSIGRLRIERSSGA